MSAELPIWLFALVFPMLFVGLWVAVTAIVPKFSGWEALEQHLPDRSEKPIRTLHFQGFYLGKGKLGASYRGCVTFGVCKSGLRVSIWKVFAPFSKPIFIEWEGLEAQQVRVFAFSATRLKIGPRAEYWMTVTSGTARRIMEASGGKFCVPAG